MADLGSAACSATAGAAVRLVSDIEVHSDGPLLGIHPASDRAREWMNNNVATEPWQWLGSILWLDDIEIATEILKGAEEDGLVLARI